MDREQLIECITDGLCPKLKDPTTPTERELWRNVSRPVSRNLAIRALDALTAAGMVVVNATPTDAEIEKISEGMGWTGDEPTIRMWVGCLIREMREAANAE